MVEDRYPSECVYTPEEQQEHANIFHQWFNNWVADVEEEMSFLEQEEREEFEDGNGDGEAGVSVGDDRSSC